MGVWATSAAARRVALRTVIAGVGGLLLLWVCLAVLGLLAAYSLDSVRRWGIPFSVWHQAVDLLAFVPLSLLVGWVLGRYLARDAGLVSLGVGVAPLLWMTIELFVFRDQPWAAWFPWLLWALLKLALYCLLAVLLGSWWGRRQRRASLIPRSVERHPSLRDEA